MPEPLEPLDDELLPFLRTEGNSDNDFSHLPHRAHNRAKLRPLTPGRRKPRSDFAVAAPSETGKNTIGARPRTERDCFYRECLQLPFAGVSGALPVFDRDSIPAPHMARPVLFRPC